ncbi:MAG: 4Fe-4S binding protein [Desulfurococcaceae archaeon]
MARLKLAGLAFRNLVSRAATLQYPREPADVEEGFRGAHYVDLMKCTGCSLCAIECPADAIKMAKIPEGVATSKANVRRLYPLINYGRCVFCYRCVAVCPFNAFVVTNRFELSGPSRPDSSEQTLATGRVTG